MYLEISGRRTGKTTRLIAAAEEVENAVIFVPVGGMKVIFEGLTSAPVRRYKGNPDEVRGCTPFFDEFDMIENVPIVENGYYVTTPFGKYGNCRKLVEANGGKHIRYKASDFIEVAKDRLTPDQYASEMLGVWE